MYHKNAISVRRISKRSPGSTGGDLLVSTESGGSLGLDPPTSNFSAKLVNDAERTNPADLDLGDSYVDNARLRPKPADLRIGFSKVEIGGILCACANMMCIMAASLLAANASLHHA